MSLFPLRYPDSTRYSVADFDAVARAYVIDGRSIAGACSGDMSEPTARRFLHRNGLVRPDSHARQSRHYRSVRVDRATRTAQLTRQGRSAAQIGRALRISARTVQHDRRHAREIGLL